jgi:hypothetical protein
MFRLILLVLVLGGCAGGQIIKAADGFVKIHDAAQEGITDIQTFCVEVYPELSDREKLQQKVGDFCDRMDDVFDRIQEVEEEVLKDD